MRPALAIAVADISELPADDYVGLIDEAAIACLSVRLATEGLLAPIWVRRNGNAAKSPWSVIAGRHRLRAARKLGWTEIDAVQYADASDGGDVLRRLQVAENLDRRTLRPIERAISIMARWTDVAATATIAAASCQHSHAARQRWSAWETISHTAAGDIRAIDVETAAACGVTDRTIRSYRTLYTAIVRDFPDQYAALNAHPLGESLSAMVRVAQFPLKEARRKAIDMILSRPDWQSIDAALVAAGLSADKGNRIDPTKLGAVMMDAWDKMPLTGQRAHQLQKRGQ